MNLVSGRKLVLWQILVRFYLSLGSRISGIVEPGNTPDNNADSSGISSAISLGTTVSQTDLNNIFCSNYSSSLGEKVFKSIFYYLHLAISSLFMLPADTNTLFKALSPKS